VQVNPVLRRELKERMRDRRTGFVLTVYLALLAIVLYALYNNARRQQQFGGVDPLATANVGRGMFEALLFTVLLLVCFLVPGNTAEAIVGERERQTLIPMQVTLLSPRSVVVGKLLASLAYLSLLVVATTPLLASSFLFGGVTLVEMVKGIGMVMVTGIVLAALALAASSMARRVQTATILAYGMTLLLLVGTFAFYGFENVVSGHPGTQHNKAVLVLNPLVATADAVAGRSTDIGSGSPLTSLRNMLHRGDNQVVLGGVAVGNGSGSGGFVAPIVPGRARSTGSVPYAGYSLLCFTVLTLGSLALTVRRLRTPAASDRA
jgi:ABC-2 type transport system permease protein